MMLARVDGAVVATRKHPSLDGWRLLLCQPVNGQGEPEGQPVVAIDSCGAGQHSRVIVSTDGASARAKVGDSRSPVRLMIIAVVDEAGPEEAP